MKYAYFLGIILLGLLQLSCSNQESTPQNLPLGIWRGVITQQGQELPFNFTLKAGKEATAFEMILHNGTERILVDEVTRSGDSLFITFNFFDTEIRAGIENNTLVGTYNKRYSDEHILGFRATFNDDKRFVAKNDGNTTDVAGRYQVMFVEEDGTTYPAVAKLEQEGSRVTGTFLTETGDYRYLEGIADGNDLKLSAFDGTHLFLFTAKVAGDSLTDGDFWHAKYTHETWSGVKNPEASLSDQYALTYLKEVYDKMAFSFPNTEGEKVSLTDAKYQDKVVILQIFGTWCPNCLDETLYYRDWYNANKDRGAEIIGLAYENKADFDYASGRVNKMVKKLGVPYEMLIAGTSNKAEASKTLPMLNHIISFPTSIFLDRKGNVRRIHTGFSGPGTGEDYEKWQQSFTELTEELLSE